jgi:uncharacterized protein YbjQ (UPF0145 family)
MEQLILFAVLLALGYTAGTIVERRHFRSIEKRERELIHLPALTLRSTGESGRAVRAELVCGSAVVSVDYFKRILAGLKNLFGGTITSYESLIDRARREALLRMKAAAAGSTLILNVRIETSTIGNNAIKKGMGSVEAIAYGTAVTLEKRT